MLDPFLRVPGFDITPEDKLIRLTFAQAPRRQLTARLDAVRQTGDGERVSPPKTEIISFLAKPPARCSRTEEHTLTFFRARRRADITLVPEKREEKYVRAPDNRASIRSCTLVLGYNPKWRLNVLCSTLQSL